MKNVLFLLINLLIIITTVTLFGCKKRRGCNVDTACNYDPAAEKNDGSCEYPPTWYKDSDGDGVGDPNISVTQCDQPIGYVANSRPIAPDFNVADCNGTNHHLYTELEAKTIVVMAWVMPCSACIPAPLEAISIVKTYSTNHPGRVVFYLADDYGDQSCSDITGWAGQYGMTNATIFSNPSLSMTNYGFPGMPKIVVMAGPKHEIYYDEDGSTTGLKAAIDQAIADNP